MTPFASETPLIDRLRGAIPQAIEVVGSADIRAVSAEGQVAPALHVLHGGFRVRDASDDGQLAVFSETWLVVIVVRSAVQTDVGRALHIAAAPLLAGVLRAVLGWQPHPECRPFRASSGPGPIYQGSLVRFVLPFVTEFAALGDDSDE